MFAKKYKIIMMIIKDDDERKFKENPYTNAEMRNVLKILKPSVYQISKYFQERL